MGTMYTISDIAERTGFKEKYIRGCLEALKDDVLKDFLQRGDKNAWLLDSNALTIFDVVKGLREQGYSISSIHDYLMKEKQGNQEGQTPSTIGESQVIMTILNELKTANQIALKAQEAIMAKEREMSIKDTELKENRYLIDTLKENLQLLTDGKPPKEAKAEREETIRRLTTLEIQVETQTKEIEAAKKEALEKEEALNIIKTKQERQQELLKDLAGLEGKWFTGKKRKTLIEELHQLA
jgi:hypothetical protein